MNNIFSIYRWNVKKIIIISLSLQLILIGTLFNPSFGFDIAILRPFIGFILITFIPGLLIIKILRFEELDYISSSIIIIGLSLITVMIMGFFINSILPNFGIVKPLTPSYILASFFLLVNLLGILAYLLDTKPSTYSFKETYEFDLQCIFLCLLPVLSILGAFLVNFYNVNSLLLILILAISIVVILIGLDKFFQKELYPLAVFSIGLSLLFHNSLISTYIWGWDIQLEYYYILQVMKNSYWNYNLSSNINGMLSVVILPTIYSHILNLNVVWVLKIIYPFFFSLVPVGLFNLYKTQFNEKVAFFSIFYFMSIFIFYVQMLTLPRQQIGEFFFMVMILLIFGKLKITQFNKHILLILFSIGLITSHYGLAYIVMFALLFVYFISHYILRQRDFIIDYKFITLYIIVIISWYLFTTSGLLFNSFFDVISRALIYLEDDVVQKASVSFMTVGSKFITEDISRYMYIITQMFISLGIITLLFKSSSYIFTNRFGKNYYSSQFINIKNALKNAPFDMTPSTDYLLLSLIFLIMIAFAFFTKFGIDIGRLFHIALIVISPFCIIGYFLTLFIINSAFKYCIFSLSQSSIFKPISLFLVIFFLFNVGFISEVVNDNAHSISISQDTVDHFKDPKDKVNFYRIYNTHEQDIYSIGWMNNRKMNQSPRIYADSFSFFPLLGYGMTGGYGLEMLTNNTQNISHNSYLLINYINKVENLASSRYTYYYTAELEPLIDGINEIYSNGGGDVYINE